MKMDEIRSLIEEDKNTIKDALYNGNVFKHHLSLSQFLWSSSHYNSYAFNCQSQAAFSPKFRFINPFPFWG